LTKILNEKNLVDRIEFLEEALRVSESKRENIVKTLDFILENSWRRLPSDTKDTLLIAYPDAIIKCVNRLEERDIAHQKSLN